VPHSHSDILRWGLTFVFDSEDLVRDTMPYVGYIDDLYTMEAALLLVRKGKG